MFVNEIAAVFTTFDDEEAQKCVRGDFAQLGAEDAARYFARAEHILEAYMHAAEHLDVCLYVALSDAHSRATEARRVAERYARATA